MPYCKYLRKSRADAEAEERGEGETLARHSIALDELAQRQRLNVTKTYREIVSGETISARPVMQQLLHDVENGMWEGVLVVEVERLSRGDTKDQGTVAQTFKYSNTKIVTPSKIYNPQNEFDEEYFEFGLYMSRREYKTINRRMNIGRLRSVSEGKFVANKAPFGYERVKLVNEKGYTLAIVEDKAEIVHMIFDYYTKGKTISNGVLEPLGSKNIANELNKLGIKTATGNDFSYTAVMDILRNPTYIGKIKWGGRPQVKKVIDGVVVISRPRKSLDNIALLEDGRHEPIITPEQFYLAQDFINKNRKHTTPSKYLDCNPLAGFVVCAKCGKKLVRRPSSSKDYPASLMCVNTKCSNASSFLYLVEIAVLNMLKKHLLEFKTNAGKEGTILISENSSTAKELAISNAEMVKLQTQLNNLFDLLEQGIYTKELFTARRNLLTNKIVELQVSIDKLEIELLAINERLKFKNNIIPRLEHVLDSYDKTENITKKRQLLESVVEKVIYTKQAGGRWKVAPDNFTVEVYPKL